MRISGCRTGFTWPGFGEPVPDIAKALHGIPQGSFILLLAHRPGQVRAAAKSGAVLQLSGHTHGGMVYGLDWFVGQFNCGFVSGLYEGSGFDLPVDDGEFPLPVIFGNFVWIHACFLPKNDYIPTFESAGKSVSHIETKFDRKEIAYEFDHQSFTQCCDPFHHRRLVCRCHDRRSR